MFILCLYSRNANRTEPFKPTILTPESSTLKMLIGKRGRSAIKAFYFKKLEILVNNIFSEQVYLWLFPEGLS